MKKISFSEFKTFVDEVTDSTSKSINQILASGNLNSYEKSDGSVVTDADFYVEKFIRKKISNLFKDHEIIGEEFNDFSSNSSCTWLIDPIDGTFNFTAGVPFFGTLIGFIFEDNPLYGAMRLPKIGNDIYTGNNESCFLNDTIIRCSAFKDWHRSLILTTDEVRIRNSPMASSWHELSQKCGNIRTWGDCYGYSLVCQGKADAMLDIDLKPHDILPLLPILRGAGLSLIDLSNQKDFSSIIACKPEIKEDLESIFGK